jgi:hypothetical protein
VSGRFAAEFAIPFLQTFRRCLLRADGLGRTLLSPYRDSPATAEHSDQLAAWRVRYEAITPVTAPSRGIIGPSSGSLADTLRHGWICCGAGPLRFFDGRDISRVCQLNSTTRPHSVALDDWPAVHCSARWRSTNLASPHCERSRTERVAARPAAALVDNDSSVAVFTHQIVWFTRVFASPQVDTPNLARDRLG